MLLEAAMHEHQVAAAPCRRQACMSTKRHCKRE